YIDILPLLSASGEPTTCISTLLPDSASIASCPASIDLVCLGLRLSVLKDKGVLHSNPVLAARNHHNHAPAPKEQEAQDGRATTNTRSIRSRTHAVQFRASKESSVISF